MTLHRTIPRRVPDWQVDCIDGKARWLVPWAIFAVLLFASLARVLFPLFVDRDTLRFKYVVELRLNIANDGGFAGPDVLAVRVDSSHQVHVGEAVLTTNPGWHERVRLLLQQETKSRIRTSTVLIEVAPNVPWEVVATISASIQRLASAPQYLRVLEE